MRNRHAGVIPWVLGWMLAVGGGGCHEGELGRGLGAACDEDTTCREPYVCDYGRCRSSCAIDADCPGGACVRSATEATAWVCTVPSEGGCKASGCPKGLVCGVDDLCRTGCDANHPCTGVKLCVAATCFDAPPDGGEPPFDSGSHDVTVGEPQPDAVPDISADASDAAEDSEAGSAAEKWLVVTSTSGTWTAYTTERDCKNPKPVCDKKGCDASGAFSPSGTHVVVPFNCPDCELGLVDLESATPSIEGLGVKGSIPFWRDEDRVSYMMFPQVDCPSGVNQIRTYQLSTKADSLTLDGIDGRTGGYAIADDEQRIGFYKEVPNGCWSPNTRIFVRDIANASTAELPWSVDGHSDSVFALLPDHSGFLAQSMQGPNGYNPPSNIYKIGWDGSRATLYAGLDGATASEAACTGGRRPHASGEFYCSSSSGVHRLDIDGHAPVPVACTINGAQGRVVDVWQEPGHQPDGGSPQDASEDQESGALADFAWAAKKPMTLARGGGTTAVIGGQFYAMNGHDPNGYPGSCRIVEAYDPVADKWIPKSTYPRSEGRYIQGVAAVGNKVFVFGGINCWGNYATNTVDEYDATANQWSLDVATYPLTVLAPICVGDATEVYCFGGGEFNGIRHKNSYRFSPASGSFTPLEDMPTARDYGLAIRLGGKIFVIGGEESQALQSLTDKVEVYDVSAGTWASAAPMPVEDAALVGGEIGGKIYVAGGWYQGAASAAVFEYDPAQDHWRSLQPMPVARVNAFGGVLGSSLFLMGGDDVCIDACMKSEVVQGLLQP